MLGWNVTKTKTLPSKGEELFRFVRVPPLYRLQKPQQCFTNSIRDSFEALRGFKGLVQGWASKCRKCQNVVPS